MCDVDEQAVVNAVDVPSIYDIPTMLNEQGLDEYIVRHARTLEGGRGRLVALAARAAGRPQAEARGHDRPGRQVHRPAGRLSLGHRGAQGRRVRGGDAGQDPLDPLGRVRDARGRRQGARRDRRHRRAGRVRHPRHRGQARRAAVRARAGHPDAGAVPRAPVHGDRVRPPRRGPRRRVVERVRPRHRVPRHRDDGRAGRHPRPRRHGRHDAPRALPGRPRRGIARGRAVRRDPASTSATATATRSTTATATRSPRPAWCSRASRPTATSSSTSSCRATCTRTTSPRRRTPSCARGRPTRIRCSAGWSARRSSATVPASCSTSSQCRRARASLVDALRDEPVELEVVDERPRLRGRGLGRPQRHACATATARSCASTSITRAPSAIVAIDDDGPGAADPAVPASDPPPRLGDPRGAARRRGGVAARDRAARARGRGRPRRGRLAAARQRLHDSRRQRRGRAPVPRARVCRRSATRTPARPRRPTSASNGCR